MSKSRASFVFVIVAASFLACSTSSSVPTSSSGSTQGQPTATQTVGSAGGTVTTSGVTLTIPAGALPGDTTITITADAGPIPSGYSGVSTLYAFGPDGTQFQKPVTVDFTFTSADPSSTIFWSNASGGFDPLATTMNASDATASITHFSQGFLGEIAPQDDAGADASIDEDSGSTIDASFDAGPSNGTVSANIDGVATTFAIGDTVTYTNGLSSLIAYDSASVTHWEIQLEFDTVQQQGCSPTSTTTSMTYTHYTAGVADEVYSTKQTGSSCYIFPTSIPYAAGDHATGTFNGTLNQPSDAGSGTHTFATGTFDVIH